MEQDISKITRASPPISSRTRSTSKDTQPLNSTERNFTQEELTNSYRDITKDGMMSDTSTDMADSTSIPSPTPRGTRTSEDEYMLPDQMNKAVEAIQDQLDWFECDFCKQESWEDKLASQNEFIATKIQSLLQKASIVSTGITSPTLTKLKQLSEQLAEINERLQTKARSGQGTGTRVSLKQPALQLPSATQGNTQADRTLHNTVIDVFEDDNSKEIDILRKQIHNLTTSIQEMHSIKKDVHNLKTALADNTTKQSKTIADMEELKREVESIQHAIEEQSRAAQDYGCNNIKLTQTLGNVDLLINGLQSNVRENKKKIQKLNETLSSQGDTLTTTACSQRSKSSLSGEALSVLESSMEDLQGDILIIISKNLDTGVSQTQLANLVKKKQPALSKMVAILYDKLMRYTGAPTARPVFSDKIKTTLSSASKWSKRLSQLHVDMGMDDVEDSSPIPAKLAQFSPAGNQHVFEFISDFERIYRGRGNDVTKANQLWEMHLNPALQVETEIFKHNLDRMLEFLTDTFGTIDIVVNTVMRQVENTHIPSDNDPREKLTYLRKFLNALQKLLEVPLKTTITKEAWENHVFSTMFIQRLRNLLSYEDKLKYAAALTAAGLHPKRAHGRYAIDELTKFLEETADNLSSIVDLSQPLRKSKEDRGRKPVHAVTSEVNSGTPDDEVYQIDHSSQKQSSLKKPCALRGHDHELGSCEDFLGIPAHKRRILTEARLCWTCLGPRSHCKVGNQLSCKYLSSLNKSLICSLCDEYIRGNSKPYSPCNVLMCTIKSHASAFPASEVLLPALDKLLPKFDKSKLRLPQIKSVNTVDAIHTSAQSKPKRTGIQTHLKITGNNIGPVAVDSQTGKIQKIEKQSLIHEVKEASVFIIQMMRIGDQNSLVLFDKGASMHLVQGEMAEKQKLERLTDKPSTLTVVGGGIINTHYGVYRFFIGPTPENKYHEVVAQGIPQVTGYFNKVSMDIPNGELQSHDSSFDNEVLPKYVGGSHAQLLLGIKDPRIHPKEIFILPSGLGVYKSKFKDIFGSRICFGGPHFAFSNNPGENPSIASFIGLVKTYYDSVYDSSKFLNYWPDERSRDYSSLHDFGKINAHRISCDLDPGQKNQQQAQGIYKANIPMARYRELLDQEKDGDLVNYRCEQCSDCTRCKESGKSRAITLREKREQAVIEDSVTLDYEKRQVRVILPFMVNPTEALKSKFKSNSNYDEALKVYLSQTRKPREQCEAVRGVITELINLDFMCLMSSLPEETQRQIVDSPVLHYYPWRIVVKLDSPSTPVRIVVDPSMTGLNLLLAKGENVIGKITDIIIRNRLGRFGASTDIRKMYNQLRLEPSEYPYSLFLYHPSMDPHTKPDIFVMKSAWYGVTSTGNQADFAVSQLANDAGEEFNAAKDVLKKYRYVDDSVPSANTIEEREEMLSQTEQLLDKIGFKLKYVIRSGESPPTGAAPDGTNVKTLGYNWNPKEDILSPAYGEINFNPRRRGAKKPNVTPITTPADVKELLRPMRLTKRDCLARSAEFFDPAGIWEPWKLQLKMKLSAMNHLGWDEPMPDDAKEIWVETLAQFTNVQNLSVPRTVIPPSTDLSTMRMICLSDAAENAIGAAIYVGFKLQDGSFSCQLLTAKSKMASHTIPRNELCGILLMAELAYITKNASPITPSEIIYATDSTIAMSWCSNPDIKLKQFVLNRVESINRLIEWTTGTQNTQVHHIAGEINLADKLTRQKDDILDDISMYSEWQNGLPWMMLPTEHMPLLKYDTMVLSPKQASDMSKECHELPFSLMYKSQCEQTLLNDQQAVHTLHAVHDILTAPLPPPAAPGGEAAHTDLVKKEHIINFIALGWRRALRVLTHVIRFVTKLKHKLHMEPLQTCMYCNTSNLPTETQVLTAKAEKVIFTLETNMIKKTWPKNKLVNFVEQEGILYFSGRLEQGNKITIKDIDFQLDLVNTEFNTLIPVVRPDSQLFFAYVWNVHHHIIPHAGIELTVRELLKKMYIPGHFRHVIKRIKQDCSRCNIIAKNTVSLELAKHHFSRTLIAPVFYTLQADIMYGFKAKPNTDSRKTFKLYALVLVCLHTSATNILAIDAIDTQSVVNALERHACRYGMPAQVYVDNGSQLKALDKTLFSIRDVDAQLYDSRGIRVFVSTAKSHEERGKVENKIRTIRELLKKSDIQEKYPLTPLQWETIFAQIANSVDDIPIAKGNCSSVSDLGFDILSPNRLKMGRNNYRSLHTSCKFADPTIPSQLLEKSRKILSSFFQTLVDSLHHFQVKPGKWGRTAKRTPKIDDVVLFKYNESNSAVDWKLGRVAQVEDRSVQIMYSLKSDRKSVPTMKFLKRSFRDVVIIFSEDEIYQNSEGYFNNLIDEISEQ